MVDEGRDRSIFGLNGVFIQLFVTIVDTISFFLYFLYLKLGYIDLLPGFRCQTISYGNLLKQFDEKQFTPLERTIYFLSIPSRSLIFPSLGMSQYLPKYGE